jgi:uncharacterized membrane protein YbhN (UPF0104 family)
MALVILVHVSVGWPTLLAPWKELSVAAMAGALGMVVASYAIRTVRVHHYFRPETTGRFGRSFRLILLHNLLNNLLPMRSGEVSFPILMQREFRVPFSRSLPGLLYLRLLDLHFLLFLATLVLLSGEAPIGWVFPVLLALLPLAVYAAQEGLRSRYEKRSGRLTGLLRKGLAGFPSKPGLFWATWLWTAVNWGVKLLVFAWVLRAFTPMPLPAALMGSVTGELSSVLPFHGLAGAGTYEAGVMAGLVPLGIGLEPAAVGAVNLHLFVLGVSVLTGLLALVLPRRGRQPDPGGAAAGEGTARDPRENPAHS